MAKSTGEGVSFGTPPSAAVLLFLDRDRGFIEGVEVTDDDSRRFIGGAVGRIAGDRFFRAMDAIMFVSSTHEERFAVVERVTFVEGPAAANSAEGGQGRNHGLVKRSNSMSTGEDIWGFRNAIFAGAELDPCCGIVGGEEN